MTTHPHYPVRMLISPSIAAVLTIAAVLLSFAAQPLAAPTQSSTTTLNAPPGVLVSIRTDWAFDSPGTNARITEATFSDTTYYNVARVANGHAWVESKTEAELNALPSPPPGTFETTVDVTMTNDEGQTATGTFTLQTSYDRASAGTGLAPPSVTPPTFAQTAALNAAPGVLVTLPVADAFDNPGTNPRYASANYSTTAVYYSLAGVSLTSGGHFGTLVVQAKTAAELNALASPPASPITLTAEVSMTNDEGQTATGTITFQTHYARGTPPTFTQASAISTSSGTMLTINADQVFENAGTNPRITAASTSDADAPYCSVRIRGRTGATYLVVTVQSDWQLGGMSPLPDNPFTFSVQVTMTNDEGHTATGSIAFSSTWSVPSNKLSDDPEGP